MTTYTIPVKAVPQTWQARAKVFLLTAVFVFVLSFGFSLILRSLAIGRSSRNEQIFMATTYALIFGFTTSYRYSRAGRLKPSTLSVDSDSITGVTYMANWMWPFITRTVHKDKVKTLWEIRDSNGSPRGIAISEASKFQARFHSGFVFIPSSLPNYEELKSLVEGWHKAKAHSSVVE